MMFKNKKLINYLKNIIIALLLVSALILMSSAFDFRPANMFSSLSGFFSGDTTNQPDGQNLGSIKLRDTEPMFILVTTVDGAHFASKYDKSEKKSLSSQFSAALGEALGSAGKPIQITHQELQDALKKPGVFFDYVYPQSLASISLGLGTNISDDVSAALSRRLFLSIDGSDLFLYFISSENDQVYLCSTALLASSISSKISEIPSGASSFAFELSDEYASLDPYFILSPGKSDISAVAASNPLRQDFSPDGLLELFHMNLKTSSENQEGEGSIAYVDGSKTLKYRSSGSAFFSVSGGSGIPVPHSDGELKLADSILAATEIVQGSIALHSGEAGTILSHASGNASSCTIYFNYTIGGIPILTGSTKYAAKIEISDGEIVHAELVFRRYSYTDGAISYQPETHAAAMAIESGGGEPLLIFEDRADRLSNVWINNK